MTYNFIMDYNYKKDSGLIDTNKTLISITNIGDEFISIFDKIIYISNYDDESKSLKELENIKIKMVEELLNNLGKEIIESREFINYYYWVTDLDLKILIKNIAPHLNNSSSFIKNFVDKNKLIIKYPCIKCNKEIIIYQPKNRNSRDSYIEEIEKNDRYINLNNYYFYTIKDYVCDDCAELIKKEKEIKEQIAEKEKEEKRKLQIQKELDYIQELKTMSYKEYLETDHWREKRKSALYRAKFKCQLCSSKENLHVHHNTYENRGNEKNEDLIVLCKECHERHHGKLIEEKEESKNEKQIEISNQIKTKLFISEINTENDNNDLDNKINEYINKNNITNIISMQTNFNSNNLYSILLVYNI